MEGVPSPGALAVSLPQLKSESSLGSPLDALSTKCLEECSEGDISSPASTGTQVTAGLSNVLTGPQMHPLSPPIACGSAHGVEKEEENEQETVLSQRQCYATVLVWFSFPP